MGMKADGNLYIAAQFLDTFDEIGKQVEKGAAKISKDTKIDLSIDEKNILKDIDKLVGSVKFKDLDLSDVISSVFASISKEGMSSKDRTKILDNFQTSLTIFHSAPLKDIKQLKGVKSKDLTSIIQEIETDFFSESSKRKWTSINLKSNVKDIIAEKLRSTLTDTVGSIQQTLIQEFGENIAKYGVDAKTAKNKLKAIYEKAFNEKGEMDVFGLTDNDFTSTSQKMKDFRGYYQRLNKLKEEIPEEFEELFLAIGDYLDDFENDKDTEKAVKDWIESIFQLEDKVIDYANREEALNKELANKVEAKNQQQKENKSSTKQTVKPKFDTDVETKKVSSEGSEIKKGIETKSTQSQNTTVEVEKQKTIEIEKQNQATQELIEKSKEVNKTESAITEEKKKQNQENKNHFQLWMEQHKKQLAEEEKENAPINLKQEEEYRDKIIQRKKDIQEILNNTYENESKTELYNNLKKQKNYLDELQKQYNREIENGYVLNAEEQLPTINAERLQFLKMVQGYQKNQGSPKRLEALEDHLSELNIDKAIEELEPLVQQFLNQLDAKIIKTENEINRLKQLLPKEENILNNETSSMNASQDQMQQEIQETSVATQSAIESNKQLAESVQEVTQAVQQEEQVFSDAEKQIERNNSILYHYGDYSKNKPSHQFGDEWKSWRYGIEDTGVGYGDGTGTYVSNHIEEYDSNRISDKSLTKFYSIDVSKLNLYEAHTEEQAEIFHKFIHHLEQYCIMLGSGFEGFADNLKNVDAQSLYSDFKKVFPSIEMSFEEFNDFISRMRNLVIESGMNKNGEINPQKLFEFKKNNGIDDIKTRFLKELGYHGTNLSGTSYGGLRNGSVLFDDNARLFTVTSGKLLSDVVKETEEIINSQKTVLQKHGIEINSEDLVGASTTELEKIQSLLKEIYNDEIQLQNAKIGSKIESSINEKINTAKTKIEEIKTAITQEIGQITNDTIDGQLSNIIKKLPTKISKQKASDQTLTSLKELMISSNPEGVFTKSNTGTNAGLQNRGVYVNKDYAILSRDIDYTPKIERMIQPLNEAYEAGANVARVLGYVKDEEHKLVYEIQEAAQGELVNSKNIEYLSATDEQIQKLIDDILILQQTGLYFDLSNDNLLYDKKKGFTFLDLGNKKDSYFEGVKKSNDINEIIDYILQYLNNKNFKNRINGLVKKDNNIPIQKEEENINQEEKKAKIKNESLKLVEQEAQTEHEITNELHQQKNIEQNLNNAIQNNSKESELQNIKEIENETLQVEQQQQNIIDTKKEAIEVTKELAKAEEEVTNEIQKQNRQEEQKPKIMLVHNGKKLPSVEKHGKSQAEINAQLKEDRKKRNTRPSRITEATDIENQEAKKVFEEDKAKDEAEIKANEQYLEKLRQKYLEAKKAKEEAMKPEKQQIEASSEQIQRITSGVENAIKALKEYKIVNDRITEAQNNKDGFKPSEETTQEMLQAGAFSSYGEMGRYIQSLYRVYKKTGATQDEKILQEALRVFMSYVGKDKETGQFIHRDNSYLFSKKNNKGEYKEVKTYANDKKYKEYINQAQKENASFEDALINLSSLKIDREDKQKEYVAATLQLKQLLQEVGLESETINEIIASINGNLTNEEAIWEVLNSYIKEATQELAQQKIQTENISSNNVINQEEKKQEAIQETIDKAEELNTVLTEEPPSPTKTDTNIELSEPKKQPEKSQESTSTTVTENSIKAINEESDSLKEIKNTANQAAKAKENFANANKKVKQSAEKSTPSIKKEANALEKAKQKAENEKEKEQKRISTQNGAIVDNRAKLARETEKKLEKGNYDKEIQKFRNIISQYSPSESRSAADAIDLASKSIDDYEAKINKLKAVASGDLQLDKPFEELVKEINNAQEAADVFVTDVQTNFSKVANSNSVKDLKTKIDSIVDTYQKISSDNKNKLKDIGESLIGGQTTQKQLADARSQMKEILSFEKSEGNLDTGIWGRMAGKMQEGVAFLATKFSFYQIFNQFRQGFEVIHQFDDALTEMMKVSDETRLSLERYQKTTFETADAIGTSALQVQQSTADWMRLGETLEEASKSAQASTILMNVSEFDNINSATESLVAMSQAYQDLTKMNIIDKLNEVGNNYAISTSEAATALQSSASALKTANNDMDEALALITAGNAVIQDATKVGAGMRTIALRLTGTKSAKDELEEMGEETENVITTQSKLRDVIKEATAVASNEYKGFDILDDNGNYKSTYEIMLGIAEVYDEIVETDKKFGRNNVNLLLENVAGKNRANIAASIFQNPQLLKDAYKSSQEANGSAMKENEKYVQSISGHLAQLKNAWQEVWANAANRDVINFFIDLGVAVLKFVNTIGVIPSTFALLLPYFEIFKKGKDGKGLISSFLEWANGLNEVEKIVKELGEAEVVSDVASTASSAMKTAANQAETASALEQAEAYEYVNYTEALESTTDLEGTITSTAKSAANMTEQFSKTGKEATGTTGKLGLLKGAFDGLKNAIGLPTLALFSFVAACAIAKKAYDAYNEARFNEAKEATDSIKQQQDSMSARIESYKELKAQLDSGDLSEQETIETKQKILDIQKEIANQYGSAAKGVDLVNGKLEEQVGILNSITEKEAGRQYASNRKGFDVAFKEYKKVRPFTVDLKQSSNDELNNQIKSTLSKTGLQSYGELGNKSLLFKNATDTAEALEKARDSLEELKKEYKDSKDIKAIDDQIEEIDTQITKAYEVIDKYEETALKGMELELARNKRTGYDAFQNYQTSTADLESAYASGNTKKIEEARKAFEEAKKAKDDFLSNDGNAQFASLFDTIDTSFVEAKNQYHDVVESFKDIPEPKDMPTLFEEDGRKVFKKNTDALKKEKGALDKAHKAAENLYKLNPDRVDIEGTLLDNAYAGGVYADALNDLINELGWSTDNTDGLINALIDAGIVQGNAADIADYASDSYNNFASSIDDAIVSIGALNTALAESASGKGITDPNLEAFRKAFGEDGLKILEKTANGYHLNTEGAYLLRNAQDALVKANYASALNEQYTALDKLQEGYQKALSAGEDTTGFVQQRQAIQNNIDKINEELMAYQNANSAYQTWLANQNSEGEREMYNSVYSGYDAVKDELDRGFAGAKTRSWLDLIFNDEGEEDFDVWTASAEELRDRFKEVKKDIEGTGGYSIADFFTVDKNGKSTSEGIWNFFDAIENKQKEVGKEFVNLEEGIFNFGDNGDYQIADLLGMDVESVQAILRAAADAGFEIHLDQPLFSMEQLEEKANSAKESLEEITGKKLNIDLDPSSVEEADESMALLSEYQQSIAESEAIEPNVKTEMLESVASLMEYIVAQKKELLENNLLVFRVDNTEIDKSKDEITDVYNKLQTYTKEIGNIDLSEAFTIDPMRINDVEYLTELQKEIFGATQTLDVDSTQAEYLKQLLVEIKEHIDLLNNTNIGIDGKITVNELMAAEQVVNDINTKLDYASQRKIDIDWSADEEFIKELDTLANLPEKAKIALNIPTDANGEKLLELAQEGNLHIGVTVDGNVPQDTTQTNIVNNQENNEVNFSSSGAEAVAEEAGRIKTYTDELTGEEHVINYSSNADVETEKANTLIEKGKKFGEDIYEGTARLQDSQAVQAFLNLFSDADKWDATDATGDAHLDDHGASNLLSSIIHDTHTFEGDHYAHYYIKVHGTIPTGGGKGTFDGTAHASGTAFYKGNIISGNAFKGGNWGVSKTQEALVGELGTEIMVTPNGQWQTIGEGGAEFTRIPKGSIIFNHKQSEELLKNGHVTSNRGRGSLVGFANGTAYSWGTGKGAIKPSSSSTGMGGSTRGSGGGSKGGGNGGNNKGNNNKSSEKAKETKNTLDEVEILIARIERQISRLDNTIGNTYTKWATRNQAVTRDLKKVSKEIVEQRKAYDTYMTKANSIGLPEEWAKKVREGKQAIEDVVEQAKESGDNADTLWDKITKYREYYEKALAALDKVQELEQKEGELYKTKFDHEQTYYEEMIDNLQHTIDIMGAYNDQLEESGKLNSRNLIIKQMSVERAKLQKLEDEYKILVKRQDEAVKSGKIKKYSEAWYEMQQAINEVRDAIVEANTNLISFDNAFREVNWNRWDKIHDTISDVTNELEFLYDLIDEDKMFDDTGTITNEGLAAFGLLAQEYDTYFAEVERYRDEIAVTKKELAEDPYNQNLVDKLKEQIEAQQDAVSGAKKMKDAMLDVAENGVKKQIDYIKKLIDDYEELMEAQKDQSDYAKKVADQQKEINKLEKQYRAIQNDTSEEGATKRQQLREQLKEKRQDLADTQEDRRISETKDMLAKFQETFEDFLENKLKDVEGIIKEGIDGINNNGKVITDTINGLASSYGYTPSQTLQNALTHFNADFASYFNSAFDNDNVRSIVHGVDTIVNYYNKAQKESNKIAMADKVKETGTHIQAYVDEKGKTHVGYFDNNGNHMTKYTGQAKSGDKIYRFENGQKVTKGNRWINEGSSKYYLNKNGTYATGITSINGKKYYFDSTGKMKTAWQTINGNKYHFNKQGVMHTGLVTIGKNKYYFDKNGVLQMGKWQTINGKRYYLSATDGHVLTGKQKINGEEWTFYNDGALKQKGWKKGTSSVPKSGYAWTNEGFKAEAIIRKSDGAILTPLNRGDSVIPSNAMKNMYQALTNPEKYLKQYTTPDVRVIQTNNGKGSSTPATINMQFIANGVQDANKFANDLMNNKKLENWIQEITLGRANGNSSFKKYSYAIR